MNNGFHLSGNMMRNMDGFSVAAEIFRNSK